VEYLLEYRRVGDALWTQIRHSDVARRSLTLDGLTHGVTYEFRVAPVTATGAAPFSSASQATFREPATPPDPVAPQPPTQPPTGSELLTIKEIAMPAPGLYAVGGRLLFTITFSESVIVRGKPQLQFLAGRGRRVATYVAGTGTAEVTFQYVVGRQDNADLVSLGRRFEFPKRSAIAAETQRLGAVIPAGLAGTVAEGVRLDSRPPAVVGRVRVPGTGIFTVGQSLDFVVRFSEAVIVGGTPRIGLTGLNGARQATYESGSGSQELTFRYVAQAGDALRGKKGLGLTKAISLASGATINDEAGNRALLKISAPSLKGIRIDATTVAAGLAVGNPGGDAPSLRRPARVAAFATLG
jgi:hypothetical protein